MESKFVPYKGITIHYQDKGKGRALVFLHGFLENLDMWETVISQIKPSYRIITIDLLGHGKTPSLSYVHTMTDMSEAVKAVLNHLKLKRYAVFGHSMGGYVSLALAERYPKNVIALGLINSTSQADSEEKKQNRNRAIVAVKAHRKSFIAGAIKQLFWFENYDVFEKEIKEIQKEALKTSVQGIIAALEGMKVRKNLTPIICNGDIKILIVNGAHDMVINQDYLRKLDTLTHIEIHTFYGGHMSHIENNKELSYIINSFIEKL